MLPEEKVKFTSIAKEEKFKSIFQKLTIGTDLTFKEKCYILSTSILFYKYYQEDSRLISFADISYYIILRYSIRYNDYKPLLDFSINFGFYPIARTILNENLTEVDSITNTILNLRINDYFKNGYTETLEQNNRSRSFLEDTSNEKCFLAPTSFGKSSIIIDYIRDLLDQKLKIAIVVPSKSLLMQTFRMIKKANLKAKILIHDEMYSEEENFIAVFTQERSLRLMAKNNIYYDVLIIDEAHNLLKKDKTANRNILLARLIVKNKSLNPNQKVIYLSPLINEVEKLRINKEQNITSHNIRFNIKEPDIYEYRVDKSVYQYNRFLNKFYKIDTDIKLTDYINNKSTSKSFIYEKSPKNIEDLAGKFSKNINPQLVISVDIKEVIIILEKEVHKDFYAIEYLKHGIIYLHGRIPDLVKEYLEEKFSIIKDIKYLIANSVVLEGINMPIDSLFIFNTNGLNGKELINLIGRVNRLNTIFSNDGTDLKKLIPQIHFINTGKYKYLHTSKIEQLRSRIFNDVVENPLLEDFKFESLKVPKEKADVELKKIEKIKENETYLYTIPESLSDRVKQSFIEADIYSYYSDFDAVIENFIKKRNEIVHNQITNWHIKRVLDKIKYLFIDDLKLTDFEFSRLEKKEARNYYENYIYVNRKKSFNERVISQIKYFQDKGASQIEDDRLFYMGETYGNTYKYSDKYEETKKKVFVDLGKESDVSKANLSIVKLKMEDDFISFKLNKFIVLMHDYDLISIDEYNEFVYGTTDQNKIALTKYGLNINLVSRLEMDNQLDNITLDSNNNLIFNAKFETYINTLTDFQQFEIKRFIY